MEGWMWPRMLWSVGFLVVTYLPLQVIAIYRSPGAKEKLAAGAPLLFMIPMIVGAMTPGAYRDGSLFGMYYCCPYLPAMIWVIIAGLASNRLCPTCGAPMPRMAWTRGGLKCPRCYPRDGEPATEPDAAQASDAEAAG